MGNANTPLQTMSYFMYIPYVTVCQFTLFITKRGFVSLKASHSMANPFVSVD